MATLRHILLGSALALTVAASVLDLPWQRAADADADTGTEAQATDTKEPQAAPAQAASAPVAASAATAKARMRHGPGNAFAGVSWVPPAPKPKPAPPPPPPRAPPLPFVYLGRMQDGATVAAFVSMAGRNHVLHSGDTVAGYRVESITPTGMTFVYLALDEKQRLPFGSEN